MKKQLKKLRKDVKDQSLIQAYSVIAGGTNENCHKC